MKMSIVLLALSVLLSLGFCAVNPQLQIYNYTLSQTPVPPGSVQQLTVRLQDIAFSACADTISVQVITSYPLSVSGLDTQYLDSLCLGDPAGRGAFTFTLPVDSLAQSGTYPVTIVTNYQKDFNKFSASNTVNVQVLGTPYVTASVTSADPVDLYPGDTGSVTVTFQNNGTGKVESGHVAFTAPPGLEVKWAGQGQDIGQIPAHGSASATFSVEVLKNTSSGSYPITAVLQYTGDGTPSATQSYTFSMPVKEKAEFVAGVDPSTVLRADDSSEVQVTLRNTGTQAARKLRVRISPIYPFSTDGTERYIDTLAPGEARNLTYLVHTDKDATAGQQISGLIIDYEDPQGNSFTDTEYFAMDVKTRTLLDMVVSYWYVFALIFLVFALIILRVVLRLIGRLWKGARESR
jgi:hypothetical protein